MRRRALLLVLFAAVALAPPAGADTRGRRDGNDARGPLDIQRIAHRHRVTADGTRQLVHTIRLRRAWPVKKLRHQGFVHLYFELRGHPGNPPERTLWIVYRKGSLVASMRNSLGDPPRRVGRVSLWRPDWRTVRVAFPKEVLRRGLRRYEWNASSFVEGRHELCPHRDGCSDWAPDIRRGLRYVRHVL